MQCESLNAYLVDEGIDFAFQLVGEEDACLDLARSEACRTVFLHVDVDGRAYSLTSNLHESELRQRQYMVACPVGLHVLTHTLIQQLPVFGKVHVDEVHHDDSSHISQSQLSCQFVSRSEVSLQSVLFLSVLLLRAVAAVHVYDVHRLRMLYDELGTVFIVHRLSESRFQLFCNIEVVEDGQFAIIQLYDVSRFGSNERHVVA